jgi:hypothetical protein
VGQQHHRQQAESSRRPKDQQQQAPAASSASNRQASTSSKQKTPHEAKVEEDEGIKRSEVNLVRVNDTMSKGNNSKDTGGTTIINDNINKGSMMRNKVEFKIVSVDPGEWVSAGPDTIIQCKGEQIKREVEDEPIEVEGDEGGSNKEAESPSSSDGLQQPRSSQKRKAPWLQEQRRNVRKPPGHVETVVACNAKVEDYGKAEVHQLVPTQFYQYAASDSDEGPSDGEAWWSAVEGLMQHDAAEELAVSEAITPEPITAVRRRIRGKRPPNPDEHGGRRMKVKRPG